MNYRYLLQTPNPFVTGDEYVIAVKEAVANKKISENAGEMITGFIDLTEKSISKIARNRNSLKIIKNTDEKNKLSQDEAGILYENDEIKSVFYRSFLGTVKEFAPLWFPNTKTIGDLHNYFLQNDSDFVLLVDEYGGFDGAVGRYDIYNYWKALYCDGEKSLNEITLAGSDEIVKYREWIEQSALEKYSEIKTFNGFLCLAAGDIPKIGDTVAQGKFIYNILDADKTKIKKIRIKKEYDFLNT
jgi:CBS domain containing-hemolysin-like protein